jgi:hypothetical protein
MLFIIKTFLIIMCELKYSLGSYNDVKYDDIKAHLLHNVLITIPGRFIAQVVSRRLPTAAAQVRTQVRPRGICGGQSSIEACFLGVLRFPLPIFIPLTTPHSLSDIRGWYNRSNSGRRTKWTQSHPTSRNYKKKSYC